ncbi:hypothetical protein [Nocardia wallacei]|uniref:Uncharacterized protein n=1 Tax=Nocardia wallacei TaxID=480035 RepID=A0A7G1KQ45_9NOCA|nr:hypothetical protein [Nocardia wallacei]BCK57385.1 hypothetical protein NWFMUON74_51570 [Nocardia wallacei]
MVGPGGDAGFEIVAGELVEFRADMCIAELPAAVAPYDTAAVPSIEHLRGHETAVTANHTLMVAMR